MFRSMNALRSTIVLALLAALALAGPARAQAQDAAAAYPRQPVRIIVGYQAGGPTDLTARIIAEKLHAALGQPFVVENRLGAGSHLASGQVAASPPDGYTLLVTASPITWATAAYRNLTFDPLKSFTPISQIMSAPQVLVVNPKVAARNVEDLVRLAKAQPGKLNYASSGAGSTGQIAAEMFKTRAGIDLVHVPYKGTGGVVTDLLGGQVELGFVTALTALPYMESGDLRAIAVAATERLPQLPNVPTMAEAGYPGVELDSWNGFFAPANTPPAIVDALYRVVAETLQDPGVRKKFEDQAARVIGSDPRQFKELMAKEVAERTSFAKSIGLRVD